MATPQRASELEVTPLLISRRLACRLLSISLPTLEKFLKNGTLRPVRLGRRVLVSRAELERLAQGN